MPNMVRCVPKCNWNQVAPELRNLVNAIEIVIGTDLIINSAYRSIDWEKYKGRSGTSSHCKGLAVDVACYDSALRYKIIQAAISAGVIRIGIGKNFIHLDIDKSKRNPIIFHYYE